MGEVCQGGGMHIGFGIETLGTLETDITCFLVYAFQCHGGFDLNHIKLRISNFIR